MTEVFSAISTLLPRQGMGTWITFLQYENKATSTSLSDGNMLYCGSKHELDPCLESCILQEQTTTQVHEKLAEAQIRTRRAYRSSRRTLRAES